MTAMGSDAPHMPLVIGMDLARALAVIRAALADPQASIQYSDLDEVPLGIVWSQRPPANDAVAPGTQIEISVSAE